ncbi:hypothetical protein DMA10_35385 [Streptomyces sp. WAC 01420]|nr:hypothetical protein DLM49_35395 [Streptomyces sp. WAC 01438]RSM87310.1 hypothetical protein DMA10_35385 [Streptomyces sp. WAC 01420]
MRTLRRRPRRFGTRGGPGGRGHGGTCRGSGPRGPRRHGCRCRSRAGRAYARAVRRGRAGPRLPARRRRAGGRPLTRRRRLGGGPRDPRPRAGRGSPARRSRLTRPGCRPGGPGERGRPRGGAGGLRLERPGRQRVQRGQGQIRPRGPGGGIAAVPPDQRPHAESPEDEQGGAARDPRGTSGWASVTVHGPTVLCDPVRRLPHRPDVVPCARSYRPSG